MAYEIRTFGDPVLKAEAAAVTDVDGKVVRLVDDLFHALYKSESGIALAAPQVGVRKQIVVWDLDDRPTALINPVVVESEGEWVYSEGCLSIPELYVDILRPNRVLVRGIDIDGNEVEIEGEELMGRMLQHEIDHLHGVLMFDRMTPEQRKLALTEYRKLQQNPAEPAQRRRLRLL